MPSYITKFHSSTVRTKKTAITASRKVSNDTEDSWPSSKSNLPPNNCMPRMAKMNMNRSRRRPMYTNDAREWPMILTISCSR